MGDRAFKDKVAKYLKGITDEIEIPEIKEIRPKYEPEKVINVLAKHYNIEKESLLKRKKKTERMRKTAIYLTKELSGNKNIEIGRIFGITEQAVSNIIRQVDKKIEENNRIEKETGKDFNEIKFLPYISA